MIRSLLIPLLVACPGGAAAGAPAVVAPPEPAPSVRWSAPAPIAPAEADAPDAAGLPVCDPEWPSRIASMAGHRRSPVVSAWLRNGVRVHHLRLDSVPGYVFITIGFCGGELLETADNRGVSLGACSAWHELSVGGMPAGTPDAALDGRDVHVDGMAGPDSIQLRVWGGRADIDTGMRVAAALLERPLVTQAALDQTMREGWEQVSRRASTPQGAIGDAISDAIFPPGQARVRTATERELGAVTVAEAQECLDRHIAHAPMEVSVVGDLSLDEAMRLAAGYLGRLPNRDRVCVRHMAAWREMPPPRYPIRARVKGRVPAGTSIVVVAFPGADASDIPELRELRAAGRVLDQRAAHALGEAGFAGTRATASLVPGTVYPGFGLVIVSYETTPEQAERAGDALESAVRDLASTGVTAEELASVTGDLARTVEKFEREPRYWASILARADGSGVDPDQVADGAAFYRGLTPAEVNAALKRRFGDGRLLRLVIDSDGTVAAQGPPADAPAPKPVEK